jgi:hypothetical protein
VIFSPHCWSQRSTVGKLPETMTDPARASKIPHKLAADLWGIFNRARPVEGFEVQWNGKPG